MRNKLAGLVAGFGLTLACSTSAFAQELTIFWAEWDPANYLQELVNEYEAETGVRVTVETTPWSDFQTKAFTEFNARGSAYDMVVGDSQWIGAASEAGHYVDLTDFFNKHNLKEVMAPATVKYYAEYPSDSGKYWSIPAEGDAVGWSYRKDWFEKPETFMHKSYDDKKAMIEELRGPFSMAMVMQEINRYADSEFRYYDRSDDADVNRMIRDTRLRERAIREIEEMKAKGHWNV